MVLWFKERKSERIKTSYKSFLCRARANRLVVVLLIVDDERGGGREEEEEDGMKSL